jgi:Immunity protein Imm1
MFAKHLSIEDGDAYELITDPEWERVGKAIKELNGKERTIICLEGERKTHMTIGGGPQVYVVYATGDHETFYTAISPSKSGDSVEVAVGQQLARYTPELLVGQDVVLKAAKLFAEKGELEPSVHWRSTEEAQTPTT